MSEGLKLRLSPASCAYHDTEKYIIDFELPGVSKDDIDVEATENGLCVVGKKEGIEYSSCYALSQKVDLDKTEAEYNDGILTIEFPFKEPIETTKIKVK